jgi:peptidyl-prolyl cis-trans isomerase B (cyclophilin B)
MSRAAAAALLGALVVTATPVTGQEVPPPSGLSADEPTAVIETSKGSFTIRLLPAVAPQHVAHFIKTAKAGGFDGTTFHRIIMGGIIQGGDPLSKDPDKASRYGTGGLGLLKAEFSELPFVKGTVAAVRQPSSVDSAGNQFFVCVNDQPSLKGQYTIFGEVTSGIDVVGQISLTPVDGDKATERVEMTVMIQEPDSPSE